MKKDKDILILYLEDYPEILETWLEFLQKHWSSDSIGLRSRERAMEVLEEWELQDITPDLVIFDRGILKYEDDDSEDPEAGNQLYLHLAFLDLPVAVFSSVEDVLPTIEPFYSHPPALGYYSKRNMEEDLVTAVNAFKKMKGWSK